MNAAPNITAPDECKVFTPPELARAMARVLRDDPGFLWLEPCVGKGVFLDALAEAGVDRSRITAIELDRHDLHRHCGEYHPGTEFLDWSLNTGARFDRIIGNPPFLKLHKAHSNVVQAALRIERPGGGTVPLRANCWYAFLCACLRLLKPGGGLCLILPAGWEYADYARDLRQHLPRCFARVEVVRGARSFFQGILDGCVVLIAEGYGEPSVICNRSQFRTLPEVIQHLIGGRDGIGPTTGAVTSPSPHPCGPETRRFGDVARVRIGAVTGAADYFLMSEAKRIELRIDLQYLTRVITKARHLEGAAINSAAWRDLRERGERVWLFLPPARCESFPEVITEYLAIGLERGVDKGQKAREREYWFRTEINPPADGFMSGMSSIGPWLCLNRARDLTATNTLYTIHFRKRLKLREKAAWALALISSTTASQHAANGRFYSKGLLKFEPQDVMDLRVPIPVDTSNSALRAYDIIVPELLLGDAATARRLAEEFVTSGAMPSTRRKSNQCLPCEPAASSSPS
ncbi:SAM-dependent DNA methyltransferase [Paludisphaera rhizosphaerae]|uniref:SAM-dependent DNA methyltransferase n=1 Tax=Paludisphaera rhizosphaerae TaxID=2711216 RepID=UPI0013EC51CA|nr:SAM-dependent DNA methyltransferase [Paludisphaera rhizosphaerae]